MGSVAPPFILCPLSESKELVGINSDRLENRVIVTLGKNIAIRYHVLEQKQEASWTCSRHWFTSPVVFCTDFEKYGAVIDHNKIILWEENDAHIASRKKYKFLKPIHLLRPTKDAGTLVIFKNGTVRFLSDAIKHRDSPSVAILDENVDVIYKVTVNEKTNDIFLVSQTKLATKPISKCGIEKSKSLKISILKFPTSLKMQATEPHALPEDINTVQIEPVSEEILGGTVVVSGSSSSFVYLSSDGYLYRQPLQSNPSTANTVKGTIENETKIAFLEKFISKTTPAIISPLNSSTVVIYGCDPSEEGATVFMYDITYDLMLSKQSLKLFGSPAIMFTIGNNVFVPVGLHILVLALRLTKSLLSSLLGQHQIQGIDFFENRDPWGIKAWEGEEDTELIEIKDDDEEVGIRLEYSGFEDLVNLVNTLESSGQPQSMICGQIIPQILERKSLTAINWIIEYICDIPEFFVVSLLSTLLFQMEKKERKEIKQEPLDEQDIINEMNISISMDTLNTESNTTTIIYIYPSNPQIDHLLNRSFDQKQMIHSLRSMDFQLVKKFIEYLLNRMESSWNFNIENENEATTEISQLLKWTCTILDAHYPQFVFQNEILLIDSLLILLKEKFIIMNEIENLEPLLTLTMTKTNYEPGPSRSSKYRCETVVFE